MTLGRLTKLLLLATAVAFNLHAQNQGPSIDTALPDQMLDQDGPSLDIDLNDYLSDPDVASPAVQLDMIYSGKTEPIYIALFWEDTPRTAQNFVDYINANRYSENLVHRSVPGFIIQGGGFRFAPNFVIEPVPAFGEIQNEPGISNTRGTLAMAKRGGAPNSATSQWFINLANNASTLDGQNGGFTVFARVLGDGMDVADEIANITVYDTSSALGGAFTDLPLTAFNLERTSFVETNAFLVEPLKFSATSGDTSLVTVAIDSNGTLTLTPSADNSGDTTITVVATDLDGATREAVFDVTVLSNVVPYSTWQANQSFPDEPSGLIDADPDHDGWINLVEYTLGTNPLEGTSRDRFITSLANGNVRVSFRENVSSVVHVQTSKNLQDWTTIWKSTDGTSSSIVASTSTSNGIKTVTIKPNPFGIDLVPRYWRLTIVE